MKPCPPLQRWEDFVRGALPEPDAARLSEHLARCADCATLVQQVESHRGLAARIREALAGPTAPSDATNPPRAAASAPAPVADVFDGYQVLRELSRTHFSIVYEAVQQSTGQRVAVKVLLASAAADPKARLRFEREVELLATLRHPGVVPIFDSGVAAGRDYFVMPFITGLPPDEFVQAHNLDLRARVALLRRICEAVAAAHLRGVIHRDLKPSNILVDESAQPHVLDFGLAKMTEGRDGDPTLTLESGQILGTPAFMAPEQAAGQTADIDVRSDVYALGLLLYRTLTGRMPYAVDGPLASILRNIQETEPRPPTAADRRLDRDLDAIVLRALAKEKSRRYQSAAALADDLARYLDGRPIEARRDSTAYVLRKFVRRHPGASAAAALLFIVSIAFAASMTVMAGRLRLERDHALDQRNLANQSIDFFVDTISSVDPGRSSAGQAPRPADQITVLERLDIARDGLHKRFAARPLVKAQLETFLGRAYRGLMQYAPAADLFSSALAIRRRELGDDHPDTLTTQNDLAQLQQYQGQLADAESLFRATLAARRRVLGDEHADTLASMNNLANVLWIQGRLDEAGPLFVPALAGYRRLHGDDHPDTLRIMNNLATLYFKQQRVDDAIPLMRETLDRSIRVHGPEQTSTLAAMQNLAVMLLDAGQWTEAESLTRQTLAARRRLLGPAHADALVSNFHLARIMQHAGRLDDAAIEYDATLRAADGVLPPWYVARIAAEFGACLTQLERYADAEQQLTAAWESLRASDLGPQHEFSRRALELLRQLYEKWEKPEKLAALESGPAAPAP